MDFVVEQVTPGVTWVLRQRVLRPHQRVVEMSLPGDDDRSGAHFAAYALRGPGEVDEVVGVASVFEQDEPEPTGVPVGWRLRGMATAPEARGRGVGSALLARVVEHVDRSGGHGIWANARIGALAFYLAEGFVVTSEPFEVSDTGPHARVRRRLLPTKTPDRPGSAPGRTSTWAGARLPRSAGARGWVERLGRSVVGT